MEDKAVSLVKALAFLSFDSNLQDYGRPCRFSGQCYRHCWRMYR